MSYRVFDSIVHGICEFPADIEPFFAHKYFERLANIAQLGTLKFVHRTARHSRKEHSIGVAHLAQHAARALGATDREQFLVTLAGAFHDVGHGPFSHTFDSLVKQSSVADVKKPHRLTHEERGQQIFRAVATDLRERKLCDLSDGEIDLVAWFINPAATKKARATQLAQLPTFLVGLDQIVNNTVCFLDVDKLDYILRDSIHLGFDTAQSVDPADILAMLSRSKVIDDQWTFDAQDAQLITMLVCTRSLLFSKYYLSPKVMSVELHMLKILAAIDTTQPMIHAAHFETPQDMHEFCALSDDSIIATLLNNADLIEQRDEFAAMLKGRGFAHKGLSHFQRETAISVPAHQLSDKSAPQNMLGKIVYHRDGEVVQANKCVVYDVFDVGGPSH